MTNSTDKLNLIISKSLKFYREKNKLTQTHLAELAGLSEDQISMIERGLRMPSIKSLCKIADVFSIEPYELLKNIDRNQ